VDVLNEVANNSNSSGVVLALIVIAIVIIIIAIPLYKTLVKAEEIKRKQYLERDQMIIEVIKENATAVTRLSTVLELNSKNCTDCKKEQKEQFERIHNDNNKVLAGINRVETVIDERFEKRREI